MGFFSRAPKTITEQDLSLQFPTGYVARPGQPASIEIVGESNYQKHVKQIHAAIGTKKFPIYLKPEPNNPHDKNAVAVMSNLGCIGYIPRSASKAWQQRALHALKLNQILIGEANVSSQGGKLFGVFGSINRDVEIAVAPENIVSKVLTDAQLNKALVALSELSLECPETPASIKSHAKKVVKNTSLIFGHVKANDAIDDELKADLSAICEELIGAMEEFADGSDDDDAMGYIEDFLDTWAELHLEDRSMTPYA